MRGIAVARNVGVAGSVGAEADADPDGAGARSVSLGSSSLGEDGRRAA